MHNYLKNSTIAIVLMLFTTSLNCYAEAMPVFGMTLDKNSQKQEQVKNTKEVKKEIIRETKIEEISDVKSEKIEEKDLEVLKIEDEIIPEIPAIADTQEEDVMQKEGQVELNEESTEVPDLLGEVEKTKFQRLKGYLKGERAQDRILGGMWSKHISSHKYNEVHNLGGLQYKGIQIGSFKNSHDDQVEYVAITRTCSKWKIKKHGLIESGWMLGPMYGYKKNIPEIGGWSIIPAWLLSFSYRNVGLTLQILPSNVVSFNTFINFDMFRRKKTEEFDL